jgi:F420-dependent oxidoreductase-like protein
MKLALGLEVYNKAELRLPVDVIKRADDVGFHSVWSAEAYGVDALSVLAYLAAVTDRIKLGTGVVQVAARTPAATAMHAMTIDALAGGGRTIIGLGVSGPQIVEGWYGQPWGSPHHWLRDYVAIMRKVLAREEPVTHDGKQISLPYSGAGSAGQAKALKSILHPTDGIEIWLASGAPLNTALCGEVADGWLPMGYGLDGWEIHGPDLAKGFAKRADTAVPRDQFQLFANLNVEITDDIKSAIDRRKPLTAMYVGGMGSRENNFHRDAMARGGFPEAAALIQERWLEGDKAGAEAAVPDDYIDQNGLIGPAERIRERYPAAVPPGATGVIIRTTRLGTIELMADIVGTHHGLD